MNKKNPKSLSRYFAVQAAYSQIFNDEKNSGKKIILEQSSQVEKKNKKKKIKYDHKFFEKLSKKLAEKNDFIEKVIEENLSKSWKINRLPKVLLAIIKVAVTEMILTPKTPVAVIITEYLELSESFISLKEKSFVNAIIENIYKKLKINL